MARYKIDCCTPDCPRRCGGCHGSCPDYKIQRAELDETMAQVDRDKKVAHGLYAARYDGVSRVMKDRIYRSKWRRER